MRLYNSKDVRDVVFDWQGNRSEFLDVDFKSKSRIPLISMINKLVTAQLMTNHFLENTVNYWYDVMTRFDPNNWNEYAQFLGQIAPSVLTAVLEMAKGDTNP